MTQDAKVMVVMFDGKVEHVVVPPGSDQEARDAIGRLKNRMRTLRTKYKRRVRYEVKSTEAGRNSVADRVRRVR